MILGSNLSTQKIAAASGYRSQTNGKPGRFHKSLEDEIRNYPDLDYHIKYCNTDRLRWTWTMRRRRWHLPAGGPARRSGRATQTVENPWLMVKTGRDMIFTHYKAADVAVPRSHLGSPTFITLRVPKTRSRYGNCGGNVSGQAYFMHDLDGASSISNISFVLI